MGACGLLILMRAILPEPGERLGAIFHFCLAMLKSGSFGGGQVGACFKGNNFGPQVDTADRLTAGEFAGFSEQVISEVH